MREIKTVAISFVNWIEDNAWTVVYSKKLHKKAYVDASEVDIRINGSDLHYTALVVNNGRTIEQLYDMFINDNPELLTP